MYRLGDAWDHFHRLSSYTDCPQTVPPTLSLRWHRAIPLLSLKRAKATVTAEQRLSAPDAGWSLCIAVCSV